MNFRQPFTNEYPITQRYGEQITSAFHSGIDYGCPIGTNILASADGTVVFAGWDTTGYGNMVIIQHSSDRSTLYAHLSLISVKVGQKVRQGQKIGESGSTGNSTGPHLHFEARTQWNLFKTHFDPFNLPLTSVDDAITDGHQGTDYAQAELSPSQMEQHAPLLEPSDLLGTTVKIVSPAGAWAHNADFTGKTAFPYGTELYFTGDVNHKDNYDFCQVVPVDDLRWVAVHDDETQILAPS